MKKTMMAMVLVAASTTFPAFRPPAVPLVSVEPHFSLWSRADRLYDVDTTHWAGAVQPLPILLEADGVTYRLCGRGDGRRIGYGGGWYDRYLAAAAPDAVALAVAYPFQILDDVPTDPNDRRVTDVVTTRSDDE